MRASIPTVPVFDPTPHVKGRNPQLCPTCLRLQSKLPDMISLSERGGDQMDPRFPHPGNFSGEGVDVIGNLSFLHSGRPTWMVATPPWTPPLPLLDSLV